ncbi:hypothetical protein PQO01_07095 [Lentisphaera marina]|uniref:hypothetical protein n=1 Tax=Lentisphaera marina TaxID=1111041 RepID=UPI002366F8C4|nr:hypothetical protein [Lentisphaera marina]MDD7984713.1 hypothetical protein [Lentisphaera marina]
MKEKPRDHRPKVISFRTALDGLNIAAKQSVLWPCHAFNISIPQKKKSGLNVFEETILKITEIESGDTYKIADIACLFDRDKEGKVITDEDGKKQTALVAFIQNRLKQLALLNDRYELSEYGQELLNEWQNKSDGNLEYTVATVFVDLLSGKLLPYVSTEQLSYKKISRIGDNGFIDFLINPTNEKSRVSARQIRPSKDSFWKAVPDSNDIIRAIREFKKKYKRYALLNQVADKYSPPVPMAEAISLHDNSELVYLHCNVLIQVGNSDLLVSDGFGFGFSESFAHYLTSQDWKWVIDIKKKGVVNRISTEKKDATYSKDYSWRYPTITKLFMDPEYGINSALKKINKSPETEHEEREYIYNRHQIGSKLYSSVEYALAIMVAEFPVSEWEQIFSGQNYENNERLLHGFATKIGLSLSPKNKQLLQVKAGAIRHIQYGKVKLQPLLAIAIAGAATKYPIHPVHDLVKNYSDFLGFAQSLKKLRDPVSHGDISDYKKDTEELKDDVNRTLGIIMTLLPAISSELSDSNQSYDVERDINQERLKAETQLDDFFGLTFVCEMEKVLKEQLIRIECMFAQPSDDQMTIEILKALAAAVQTSIQQKLRDRRTIGINNSEDVKEIALSKIIETGFYESRNEIPASLSTVRSGFIKKSIGGYGASLGADLLGLIFVASDYEVQCLYQTDPHIIRFTADLLIKRGDGNTLSAVLSRNDMESLKNNVFKTIKIIKEVF